MFVCAVSGVDGSGKSTFVATLRQALDQHPAHPRVATVWLRFDPRAASHRDDGDAPPHVQAVSTLDVRHKGHVLKRLGHGIGLGRFWVRAATALYRRQLRHQLAALRDVDVLLVDRFVVDFVADLQGSGLITPRDWPGLVERLPKADLTVVLTVPSDVLLSRRDPKEDPDRMLARAHMYESLAEHLQYPLIDARLPSALSTVLSRIEKLGGLTR